MKLLIFSVFDKAVGAFLQPFYCRSKGEAIRSFTEVVNDPKREFGRYSSDYSLMYHGEFDDSSGMFASGDTVRVIGAHEVIVDPIVQGGDTPALRTVSK
ncbi:nonstructural protein [Blackfly microvirus SF02]|uniref:Nonstructural protein n=1 Tax=Blackfly microvirus SF02 TaxID=2576452 RepID=A0A4P8PLK4_9VIRU|nr:nonstructural protein [Blackfly microvirus SF02]